MPRKKTLNTRSRATNQTTSPPTKAARSPVLRAEPEDLPFFTIGHSTRTLEEFTGLLNEARIELLADVRSLPGSRAFPQFNLENLSVSLPEAGIEYTHLTKLGGRRGPTKEIAPDVNGFWENKSFRKYADYALTDAFEEGFAELIALGRKKRTAIMCSEAVWWRCHRRIITDYLLARGETVFHIMGPRKVDAATLTPGAIVRADGKVVYPPPLPV